MSSADPEHREEEEAPAGDDEDTGAQVAPIVKLEEVAVSTGEEDEDVLLDLKSKLYRFDKDGNQWKERGAGTVKFLRHKTSGKVRLVMRQSKTLKICANHLIIPSMTVQEHAGNEKSCVWHASDYADGELKDELFCIRFASIESMFAYLGYVKFSSDHLVNAILTYITSIDCKSFMEKFQEIAESQKSKEENKDATAAADLLENLSVKEKAEAEKKETENKDTEKKETEKEGTEKKETEKEDAGEKGDKPASSSA